MKFGNLIAILMFCCGAAFTVVDIGTDISLAHNYLNNCYVCQGRWTFADLYVCGTYSTHMESPWREVLPHGLNHLENTVYSILTPLWIVLGGLAQFLLGIRYHLTKRNI